MLDKFRYLDYEFLLCKDKYIEFNKDLKPVLKVLFFPYFLVYYLYFLIHSLIEVIMIVVLNVFKKISAFIDDELFELIGLGDATPLALLMLLIGFIVIILYIVFLIFSLSFVLVGLISRLVLFIISAPLQLLNKPLEI